MSFLAGAGFAVVAALLLAALLSRRRSFRLRGFGLFARSLSSGDFGARCASALRSAEDDLAGALNSMAESIGRRITAAEAERDALLGVFAGLSDGLLVTDAQQQILRANAAAVRLLDLAPPVEGRALWELVRNETLLRASSDALRTGAAGEIQIGPLRDRHIRVALSPLREGASLALSLHDTTESARYLELRKEFVANVSHELRTPLTVIRGYVETLLDGAWRDPALADEFLSVIGRHTRLLSNLVENLLDLSRLENPQGLPRRMRIAPDDLVRRVLELSLPAAQKKRQSLEAEGTGSLPFLVGDPDYLERALSNLVDNAIKYTPEGGAIRVSGAQEPGRVRLEVSDTGIGIPEADLPRIFERFYRVDKSRSRDMGGTGLGLAIVKHVVQAHGGTVEVRSRLGRGSSFRITLPAGAGAF